MKKRKETDTDTVLSDHTDTVHTNHSFVCRFSMLIYLFTDQQSCFIKIIFIGTYNSIL